MKLWAGPSLKQESIQRLNCTAFHSNIICWKWKEKWSILLLRLYICYFHYRKFTIQQSVFLFLMASCLYIFLNFIPILTSKSQYFLQGTSTRTNHILMLRLLYFNGHSGRLPFFLLIYSHNDFLCLSHTFLLPCNSDLVLLNGWRWDVDTCWSLFRDLWGIGSGYERMVKMFNVESFKGKFSLQKKNKKQWNKKQWGIVRCYLTKIFPQTPGLHSSQVAHSAQAHLSFCGTSGKGVLQFPNPNQNGMQVSHKFPH